MRSRTDHHRRDRGTQLVELAMVLPLLAFLALVVTEGAGLVRAHQVLNNAAREGARLVIDPANAASAGVANPTADVQQAIKQYAYCNSLQLDASSFASCGNAQASRTRCRNFQITINQHVPVTAANGSTLYDSSVQVQCGYPLLYLPKLPFFTVTSTINLTATAEFRDLYAGTPRPRTVAHARPPQVLPEEE